jgi:hypothetical protein
MSNVYKETNDIEIPISTKKLIRDTEKYVDDGSNKAFVDYDPNKDTRKYQVYRNDIKYKQHKEIDASRAEWDNDVKRDFQTKDTDSLDYRLEMCEKENYETLDMASMKNDCFLKLFEHKIFPKIKDRIMHIFAYECDITEIPDLTCFSQLQTLDLSRNKLRRLPLLPESLEELIVNNNKITSLDQNLPKLLRFDGTNNRFNSIVFSDALERIHVKNNPITKLRAFNNLHYLDISYTKINKIDSMPRLKYLDMSHTEIISLPSLPMIEQLLCNESKLNDISNISSLQCLEIINTNVSRIHYIKNLITLLYHESNPIILSQKYKMLNVKKNKNNISEITFG